MTEYYVVLKNMGKELIIACPTAATAIQSARRAKEKNAPAVTVYNKNKTKTVKMLSKDTFCLPSGVYCSDVEAIVYLEAPEADAGK